MAKVHNRITSADIIQFSNSEEWFGIYNEASKQIPELQNIGAAPCEKTEYKTMVQTGLPSVGFRESNTGIAQSKPTFTTRSVICKFLDASWSLDVKVAQECEWGESVAITNSASSAMEAALQLIAKQTWYGTSADAGGFSGVATLLPYKNSAMVIDAGGTAAGTASSIFAIRSELKGVQYAWGQKGRLTQGPITQAEQYDADSGKFWAHVQQVNGHVGLQIPSLQTIGRICNLTEQDDKGATDGLIAKLLELFPAGKEPNMLFMSKRSLGQIRSSRTATNATGAEAPYPTEIFGIPIYVTEAISNTEALLVSG